MLHQPPKPRVAIACGGTGGHLFPGLAVAEQLGRHGCAVTLLISPKEVDQKAVQTAAGFQTAVLPAVGLSRGGSIAFVRGFARSWRAAAKLFASEPPEAVLAMGGFTSAPPVFAGRLRDAATFLHESNTIPGRANRWLSRFVCEAFVGFPEAAPRLSARRVTVTGTPVRPQFQPADAAKCRSVLGLDPARPVLLVTGGSQGATGLNDLLAASLPLLAARVPELQLLLLTGPNDAGRMTKACSEHGIKAVVHAFFADMHLALGAATVAVSRAGASSLVEFAAVGVPSILVPYPAATDDHQYFNARAFEQTGAALLLKQSEAGAENFVAAVSGLLRDPAARGKMQGSLRAWHKPGAAGTIAGRILEFIAARKSTAGGEPAKGNTSGLKHHQTAAI